LPDAEWAGPPDDKGALPEPPQAAGWEWELDANGVPVQSLSTTASAARGRRLRSDIRRTPPRPAPHAAVIACMDSRLKIFELLGTTEIILIHHTDCALEKITDDEFTREIEAETGIAPPWVVQAFTDAARDVRESVRRIKASPFLTRTGKIRGFVFDVTTGKLNKVR